MRKSEWSDEQLEELLQNMPKIEDHRDPRDIYQNITIKLSKKKQRAWIIPSVATAAAVLLFVVLVPGLMNWNQSADLSVENSKASESAEEMKMAKEDSSEESADDSGNNKEITDKDVEEDLNITNIESEGEYTALYEDDISNENVFTFVIPDPQVQTLVPISVEVPKEEGKKPLDQLVETMAKLEEEQWGLTEYYPLSADLSVDEKTAILNVNVASGHNYAFGTDSVFFEKVVKQTVKTLGLNKAALFTDHQPGIELGSFGNMTEITVSDDGNHGYYFYYPDDNTEKPYIVPYENAFNNIQSALDAMKENIDTHGLVASIPQEMDIKEINPSGEQILTLQLSENSSITDSPSMIHTIEAILLTAKEFDFEKVKIEYNKVEQIGKFALNTELNVPVAPNRIQLMN